MQFWNIILLVLHLKLVRTQDEPAAPEEAPSVPEGDVQAEEGGDVPVSEESVSADISEARSDGNSQDSSEIQRDSHTYVALIEIVFSDECRRTCTGAIIHDRVVITAAHCFTMSKNMFIVPELSLSFIIIGSKHMFDTGYEHYMPIERVVTHHRFKGWTADLALVYTFVSMIENKPGALLPLASEKSTTPVDSNVTVYSWGRCKADAEQGKHKQVTIDPEDDEVIHVRAEIEHKYGQVSAHPPHHFTLNYVKKAEPTSKPTLKEYSINPADIRKKMPAVKSNTQRPLRVNHLHKKPMMTSQSSMTIVPQQDYGTLRIGLENLRRMADDDDKVRRRNTKHVDILLDHFRQHYNLTSGIFGYVNLAACKKIVERTLPPPYEIKNRNEVLCYSSEEFYITNEDSGAPVVQGNELVAVTVGGVDSEGEHVAVGIRVSCFCSWIAENLPNGDGHDLHCGKSCDEHEYERHAKIKPHNVTEAAAVISPLRFMRATTKDVLRSYFQDDKTQFAMAFRPSLHRFVNVEDPAQGRNVMNYRRIGNVIEYNGENNETTGADAGNAVNLTLY